MTKTIRFHAIEKCRDRAFKVSVYRRLFFRPGAQEASIRASDLDEAFQRRYDLACARETR